jgi:hypothetical protein
MSDESATSQQTTTVVLRDGEENYRPAIRWGRGQYKFPKSEAIVAAREAMKITLDEFKSFMTTGTSPSRSPEKWKKYVTVANYGMQKVKEGKYPYVMFDVEGHPQMKEVIIFIPIEPASKLLPALYEQVKGDPEAAGIKIKSGKTAESRAKHQARLDELQWKPEHCVSSQNKTGVEKPTMPNPMTNNWVHIPAAFQVKWCCAPDKTAKSAQKKTEKRKERDAANDLLPGGVRVKTDVGFGSVSLMAAVPVGSHYTTTVVDGVLNVIVYGNVAEVEPDADAEGEAEQDDADADADVNDGTEG